jgi:hypothetical protein
VRQNAAAAIAALGQVGLARLAQIADTQGFAADSSREQLERLGLLEARAS